MRPVQALTVFAGGTLRCRKHSDVLWKGIALSSILLVALLGLVFWGATSVADWAFTSTESLWKHILHALTWLAAAMAGLTLVPILLSLTISLTLPSLTGTLFQRVAAEARTRRGLSPSPDTSLNAVESIRIDLYRLLQALLGSTVIGVLGLFLGAPIWSAAQLVFGVWCMGVDTLGIVHEAHGMDRKAQDAFNRNERLFVFGIGAYTFILYALPIVQLAAPLLATSGAAELAVWLKATSPRTAPPVTP
ncbi:MAG: EI24 domain-containing protein [Myxococcota bacterium]|nr:EI24 domain-containing protein [Myxococcota bacterium]